MTPAGNPMTALFNSAATLVGGVFYPIEIMPERLQVVPHLSRLIRTRRIALLDGASWSELLPGLLVVAASGTVLFSASLLVFRFAFERARTDGSLAHD